MNIYRYDDFRLVLRDAFAEKKKADPHFSHRRFARDAGFTNPGYLNDVIKGRRPLGIKAVEKMIRGFAFTSKQAEYFRLLALFGQAKKPRLREEYHRQLAFRRRRSAFARANPAMARYYEDLRYPLIGAAIEVLDFRGDFESLGRFLDPPVPSTDVKRCVRDLCAWGLVRQGPGGRYSLVRNFVEPCPTLKKQIRRANRNWILQALDIQEKYPPQQRHVSSILLSVSIEAEKKIRALIESLREQVFEVLKNDRDPKKLTLLNIQYFPRSRTRGR